MYFSTLLAVVGLTTQVLSLPTSINERQSTLQVLQGDVSSVTSSVQGDSNAIMSAIAKSANDVGAQVQLIATVKADLADIVSQFQNAAAAIKSSTASLAITLTAPEVTALAEALDNVQSLAAALYSDFNSAKQQLSADTASAVQKEYAAAMAAIKPFSDPLAFYAQQVQEVGSSSGSGALSALQTSASKMKASVSTLLAAVGISS